MPLTLGWREIALRLALTVVAGALIGLNRGGHGHSAGLRTTLLVCLAASLSMILANLLLDTRGKSSESFGVLDLMRLPLGVLSGIGFIGAGAIIRRGSLLVGVTTAATLWYVTMIGLCLGAGDLGLGITGTVLGLIVLSPLKWLEAMLPIGQCVTLDLTIDGDNGVKEALLVELAAHGFRVVERAASLQRGGAVRRFRYDIYWRGKLGDRGPAELLDRVAARPGIIALDWRPGLP